jgi:hypothetical protein
MPYRFWGLLDSCLAAMAKITGLLFSERNPQFMCLFIVANNIYFAGFNRMHFHNYSPFHFAMLSPKK